MQLGLRALDSGPKGPKDPNMEYAFYIRDRIMVLGTYLLFGALDP